MDKFFTFTKRIDRRSPWDRGDFDSPVLRENLLSRDGRLSKPPGTIEDITGFTDRVTWTGRYYSLETGVISPRTFAYTKDGKLWFINDILKVASVIKEGLNYNAYPNHWLFKTAEQTKMYLVDGKDLYEFDGNNDNKFEKITITDTAGKTINPIDLIEHLDRLCLISKTNLYISKNLQPRVFTDATDSLVVIVGSGKGLNLSIRKIEKFLFICSTEGIYQLVGDLISAVASTFDIELVEERNIVAARSACKVEKAIAFLASDLELWAFDGTSSKLITYTEKLSDFINPYREMLDKAVSHYYNNYFMFSFVETGHTENNLEVWWDTLEDKIEFVRGRNVSCYMSADPTRELSYMQLGRSDANVIMRVSTNHDFGSEAMEIRFASRDITLLKGHNLRYESFYPEIEPIGIRNVLFRYVLDGRLSNPSGSSADWFQNLEGENKTLGFINIKNQAQFLDRVKPKINYSKGESIRFEISDKTSGLDFKMLGIGIKAVDKGLKKKKLIGA